MPTITALAAGTRVQTHPATCAWMRGDRYGTVVGRTRGYLHDTQVYGVRVKLDRSGRTLTFHPDNVIPVP